MVLAGSVAVLNCHLSLQKYPSPHYALNPQTTGFGRSLIVRSLLYQAVAGPIVTSRKGLQAPPMAIHGLPRARD